MDSIDKNFPGPYRPELTYYMTEVETLIGQINVSGGLALNLRDVVMGLPDPGDQVRFVRIYQRGVVGNVYAKVWEVEFPR